MEMQQTAASDELAEQELEAAVGGFGIACIARALAAAATQTQSQGNLNLQLQDILVSS